MPVLNLRPITRRLMPGLLLALLWLVGWQSVHAAPLQKMLEGDSIAALPRPTGAWQRLNTTNTPPARRDAALGYDPARHRLILFGGRNGTQTFFDTWALDLTTLVWQPLATGDVPRPRARHSMVFGVDTVRNRFLITTGQKDSLLLNDIWSFDLTTDTWSEIAAQGAVPDIRYGSAGGISAGGDSFLLSHGFTHEGRYDDTRRFDLATNTWHDVTPGSTRPLPRCLHAATLTQNNDMVLFGGCASGFGPCPLNDTWLFEEATGVWSEIATPGEVEARLFPALVTLGNRNEVLLFGGEAGANRYGDSWILDMNSRRWTEIMVTGDRPDARAGHSMIWLSSLSNAPDGAALLFGGQSGSTDFNDIWLFVPPTEGEPLPVSLFLPALWG